MTSSSTMNDNNNEGILTSLRYLDNLRVQNTTTIQRQDNVDVVTFSVSHEEKEDEEEVVTTTTMTSPNTINTTISICHLGGILPFTQGNDKQPDQATFEEGAAIALAAHQLNTGDGSIVPDIQDLHRRCPIRFTVEFTDTELEGGIGLKNVLEFTNRPDVDKSKPRPCAFLGAYRSAVSIPTSIVSGLQGYVQISGASTSAALDDVSQYRLFARTVPSDHGNAIPMIQYMYHQLGITHLAIINVNDAYGNSFVEGLRIAATEYAPDMIIHPIPLDWEKGGIEGTIEVLKSTQFTYVFCLVFTAETHDALLLEAYRQGVAGTGKHNWLFADTFGGVLRHRLFKEGSSLHKAYQGVGAMEASAGIAGMPDFDKFESAINQLRNDADLEYLTSIFPQHDHDNYNMDFLYDDAFWGTIKRSMTQFDYEATIALGLAACNAATKMATADDDDGATIQGYSFTGEQQFQHLISTSFQGLTSKVMFDDVGSRLHNTTLYKMTNYVAEPDPNNEGMVRFPGTVSDIFDDGQWNHLHDYIFNDGTSNVPPSLPEIEVNQNLIHTWMRGIVLGMCAVGCLMAIGFSIWTRKNRKERVVLASQPFFLQEICVGAFILATTIVPQAIDTGIASVQGCNIACNAMPWLLFCGSSVLFSALFTKTYRINRILQSAMNLKRIKVSVQDVLLPMICLLGIVIVLLSVMTALNPSEWEERVISTDIFGRPEETYGVCSREGQGPYFVTLFVIQAGALVFTIVQAYKARHLSTEFAETRYINIALVAIVMVVFVGAPGLALAFDDPNSRVFVSSAIIFVTCSIILLLIFVPKIQFMKDQRKEEDKSVKISQEFSAFMSCTMNGDNTNNDEEGMKILTKKHQRN